MSTTTFRQHTRMAVGRAFQEFNLGRDMLIGACIAGLTLVLEVWWKLIPLTDWREHRWQWIFSLLLPFFVVLAIDGVRRIISAPHKLYVNLESQLAETRRERDDEIAKRGRPNLILEYIPIVPDSIHYSGFYLRTEDIREACNVEITSEETDGDDHPRLGMKWENPGQPIGQHRVAVIVHCIYREEDTYHQYSNYAAQQINLFFQHKRDNPRELIVTIAYTDGNGAPCPSKKFRISQDIWKDGKISCQPVKLHLASEPSG